MSKEKTAKDFRQELANKHGYDCWDDMMACERNLEVHEDQVMNDYAKYYHEQKLKGIIPTNKEIEKYIKEKYPQMVDESYFVNAFYAGVNYVESKANPEKLDLSKIKGGVPGKGATTTRPVEKTCPHGVTGMTGGCPLCLIQNNP